MRGIGLVLVLGKCLYNTITAGMAKDFDRQMKEYLAITIVSLVSYVHFGVCLF